MAFQIQWPEPAAANRDAAETPTLLYVKMRGKGYAKVELRDHAPREAISDGLAQLVAIASKKKR